MPEYINRNKALDALSDFAANAAYDECEEETVKSCMRQILHVPAADVAPVVHGRWIPVAYTSHCSCGKSYKTTYYNCSICNHVAIHQPYGLIYCPYCGAKMDGGANDAT